MPGIIMDLSCPCGFGRKDVWVGVNESMLEATFALCLECRKIVFLKKKQGGEFSTRCQQCGMKLTALNEPGAWEPAELQNKFPGTEPWMVDSQIYNLKEVKIKYYLSLCASIRILCPKCRTYSLKFTRTGLWD